jgi:hypothetical protein
MIRLLWFFHMRQAWPAGRIFDCRTTAVCEILLLLLLFLFYFYQTREEINVTAVMPFCNIISAVL